MRRDLSCPLPDNYSMAGIPHCRKGRIDSMCRSCLFQLRQRVIKRCLSQESVHVLVKAFVSSRLDYCNSLLYGVGQGQLDKLQRI